MSTPSPRRRRLPVLCSALLGALVSACATDPAPTSPAEQGTPTQTEVAHAEDPVDPAIAPAIDPAIAAAVDAADRADADKALDAGRRPKEWLQFFGIRPGQRVAELGAGTGNTSELLARVVGSEGRVYGQNSRWILERFAEGPWSERLQKPVMANVTRVDRGFDDPLPEEAHDLDAVLNVLFYHDTVWMEVDRDAMNRAIFAALKPSGVYGIIDHAAAEGAGVTAVQTLHRIEEQVVIDEVLRAGFVLEGRSDVLKNPDDTHDWSASPGAAAERRGTTDRFVLKFVKPAS